MSIVDNGMLTDEQYTNTLLTQKKGKATKKKKKRSTDTTNCYMKKKR